MARQDSTGSRGTTRLTNVAADTWSYCLEVHREVLWAPPAAQQRHAAVGALRRR